MTEGKHGSFNVQCGRVGEDEECAALLWLPERTGGRRESLRLALVTNVTDG